jgi:hypothetical protein
MTPEIETLRAQGWAVYILLPKTTTKHPDYIVVTIAKSARMYRGYGATIERAVENARGAYENRDGQMMDVCNLFSPRPRA